MAFPCGKPTVVSKKGMSALQIFRYMGFGSYKTAWLMCHKIRTAMVEDVRQLAGIVEVDETVVGGDGGNRHWDKRPGKGNKRDGKSIVIGAVKRKGNVVARVIENVKGSTLSAFVNEAVSHKVSLALHRRLGWILAPRRARLSAWRC